LVDLELSSYTQVPLYLPPILSLKAEGKIPSAFSLITFEKPTGRFTAAREEDFLEPSRES